MTFTLFADTRRGLALDSLAGLSVGDALGARFQVPGADPGGPVPPAPWPWTDDTQQAACLVECLGESESEFDRDRFAELLARRYDPARGYGAGATTLLRAIRDGLPWPIAAAAAFDGQGSAGNGAAMRAAPLGAWHADSPARAATVGGRAAEVTHAHPDGIAGGVAVAVAGAAAAAARLGGLRPEPARLLAGIAIHLRPGRIRDALGAAGGITDVATAADVLGTGARALAVDTVPFALWVAARFLDDYPAAIAACVTSGGDLDTTAAIAGGVVAAYTGTGGIPAAWLAAREALPGGL